MERQNITLSIPRKLLRHAKHIAIEKGTSLSGLLTQLLEDLARDDDSYRRAKQAHLAMLEKFDLNTGGKIAVTRGDLHERP
ncbi:MAG: CopG family transcriptional regulator [Candidatus Eremiobacteraeota bacterium]|nr:CopG family transcriptional regulator [Candidatus Eremiobacteraeota bacterium]